MDKPMKTSIKVKLGGVGGLVLEGHRYVGYSESKYRLCISLTHPRDCHFAHVQ